jgi:hypothetical protein
MYLCDFKIFTNSDLIRASLAIIGLWSVRILVKGFAFLSWKAKLALYIAMV